MWAKQSGLSNVLCGAVVVCCLTQAARGAATERPSVQEVVLSFEASPEVSAMLTRRKILERGTPWHFQGATGTIIVAGQEILVGVRYEKARYHMAMDADGNQRLDDGEWVNLGRRTRGKTTFTFQRDDGAGGRLAFGLVVTNLYVHRRLNTTRRVSGWYYVGACRKGRFNRMTLRLFDDNMDGAFTQDGQDAILIGRNPVAVPLRRVHRIAKDFYRLAVEQEGASLTLTKLETPALGLVEVAINLSRATCLVLTSSDGHTVDLCLSAGTGIPAGTYRLEYGLLGEAQRQAVIVATERSPAYPIEAGKINRLRLGPPLRVRFTATCDPNSRALTVSPWLHIVGSGQEAYDLRRSGGLSTAAKVQVLNGGRAILTGKLDSG